VKARGLALLALAAGAGAGLVWWRRRRARPSRAALQVGLADGSVRTLDPTDPATAELQLLAARVRDSLTGGA
jgi:uncharacterized lipoprotein YbaY